MTPINDPKSRGVWLTEDQRHVDGAALELLSHPVLKAARADGMSRFRSCPQYKTIDGPWTLKDAAQCLLFGAAQAAVNADPARPKVVWTLRLPYVRDGVQFPGSCYGGDTPDRVYRQIGVSTRYRYEIHGRRHPTHPSGSDVSAEAAPGPAMWGSPTQAIQSPRDIDFAEDGSFIISADASATGQRRNHLHMPEGTDALIVRDTLQDWANQVPNELTVRVVGGPPAPVRSIDQIAKEAARTFLECVDRTVPFYANAVGANNQLKAFERSVGWAKPAGVLAMGRFELNYDEALVVTLNPLGAEYLGIVLTNPWLRTLSYDHRITSLNNLSARPNADGSFTFVIASRDPGVQNWLDTCGLRSGIILARWELFSRRPSKTTVASEAVPGALWVPDNQVDEAVQDVRIVKATEVLSSMLAGQGRVSIAERRAFMAQRSAAYQVRVTGRPLGR